MSDNIVDRVNNDDNKIVMTIKSVRWIIGLLVTGILGILSFAWGLYVTVDNKIDAKHEDIKLEIKKTEETVIDKLEEMDREKVKPNSDKNYKQDLDIVRLYERTNSRDNSINHNTARPEILVDSSSSGLPTIR